MLLGGEHNAVSYTHLDVYKRQAQEPEGSAEKVGSKKGKYQKAQAKAEHTGEKLGKAREKLDKTEACLLYTSAQTTDTVEQESYYYLNTHHQKAMQQ